MYICECGRIFETSNSFNGHKSWCKIHLGEERYNIRYKNSLKSMEKVNKNYSISRKQKVIDKINNWLKQNPKCEWCNDIITIKYGSGRFCSSKCARSYSSSKCNHSKTNINIYRDIAFNYYEHRCCVCGWDEDDRILQVHHIDSNRNNNDVSNLIILCPNCHWKITLNLYKLEINNNQNVLIKL